MVSEQSRLDYSEMVLRPFDILINLVVDPLLLDHLAPAAVVAVVVLVLIAVLLKNFIA